MGMHQIIEVTEEFYGSQSYIKPFNSLERLEFAYMLEWKEWGNREFPALQYLSLSDCPKLKGKLPENLSSLTELRISECPQLISETPIQLTSLKSLEVVGSAKVGVLFYHAELFTSVLQGMKQIEKLYLGECEAFNSFSFSSLPNTLKRVSFCQCGKLKLEPPVGETVSRENDMFLEKLLLNGCDSIDEISLEFIPRVRSSRVEGCDRLTRLLIPTETEILWIYECQNLEILSVACGIQMSITSLEIWNCQKLKLLPERMSETLPSLNDLQLGKCPEIEAFPEGGLPFSLKLLQIEDCEKLVNGRKEWHLERLPCLEYLEINHDGSDEEIHWELPASIRGLAILNLKTLISSQVLKSLTSLEHLSIYKLSSAQFQTLPSWVQNLEIIGCDDQILSFPESASLSELEIHNCPNFESLPSLQSLTSLQRLEIHNCNKLQSLAVMPSSLSELFIRDCPNLKYFPVQGMPSSMSRLSVDQCPLLKPSLEFDRGDYWPKIAHIPTINVEYDNYL